MKGYSCKKIVVAVYDSCFGTAVMTERISIRWQGLLLRKGERRERKIGQHCRYNGDGEEQEEVDDI